MSSEVKICKDCGQTKLREEFHLVGGRNTSSGCRESRCKACSNEYHRHENRLRYRRKRGIPLDAPVWSQKAGRVVSPKREKRPPRQKLTEEEKFSRLLKRFGITSADYYAMLADQNGVCGICKKPELRRKRLSVDHCHATGKVRGLLCQPCNLSLGLFNDSADNLRSAAEYLESSPSVKSNQPQRSIPRS